MFTSLLTQWISNYYKSCSKPKGMFFLTNSQFVNWAEIIFRFQQSIGSLTDGIHTVYFKTIFQPQLTRNLFLITGYQILRQSKHSKTVETGAIERLILILPVLLSLQKYWLLFLTCQNNSYVESNAFNWNTLDT